MVHRVTVGSNRMVTMLTFDDGTIQQLFGADDAENESAQRLKEYFYVNQSYQSLAAPLQVRLLVGHKGVGKSALLKRAFIDDEEKGRRCVWLQPDTLLAGVQEEIKASDQLVTRITKWKRAVLLAIIKELVNETAVVSLPDLLTAGPKTLQDLVVKFLPENNPHEAINVYIDDIDRGWKATPDDILSISALLNAIRDISGRQSRIRFRLGLRSDVYFLVRTSDESTDKIDGNVIWLRWKNDDILRVLAKRISTYLQLNYTQDQIDQMEQSQISAQILRHVVEPRFAGRGKWENRPIHNVLLSLTRARPRDLVKLLRLAAKVSFSSSHAIISSADLNAVFEPYSQERLQDIVNEFRSELPEIERLLKQLKPSKVERRTNTSYFFTTDQLVSKLGSIMQNTPLFFTNKKKVTPRALIQFLYKIDFITARKQIDGERIDRRYFEQARFLADEIVDFGYSWEIHPAYRWALQPQDLQQIIDSLD